jgi:hypothetical protein
MYPTGVCLQMYKLVYDIANTSQLQYPALEHTSAGYQTAVKEFKTNNIKLQTNRPENEKTVM